MEISELFDRIRHDDVVKFIELVIYKLKIKIPDGAKSHDIKSIILTLAMVASSIKKRYGNISFEKLKEMFPPDRYQALMKKIHQANSEYDIKM